MLLHTELCVYVSLVCRYTIQRVGDSGHTTMCCSILALVDCWMEPVLHGYLGLECTEVEASVQLNARG